MSFFIYNSFDDLLVNGASLFLLKSFNILLLDAYSVEKYVLVALIVGYYICISGHKLFFSIAGELIPNSEKTELKQSENSAGKQKGTDNSEVLKENSNYRTASTGQQG
jgi:hypothetical protein